MRTMEKGTTAAMIMVAILDGEVPWEVVDVPFDVISSECTLGGVVVGCVISGGGVVGDGGRITFGGQVGSLA